MNTKQFNPGIEIESHTTYKAVDQEYHIYLSDTKTINPYAAYEGDQNFQQVAFVLENLENVTIDLGGAQLIFHGRIIPFFLNNCRNVIFKNFSIDYDRPFYTQADIIEATPDQLLIKINDGYPHRIEGPNLIVFSDTWENPCNQGSLMLQAFDRETMAPAYNSGCILALIGERIEERENPPLPIHHLTAEQTENETVRLHGDFPKSYKPGQILVIAHEDRFKPGFMLENCENTSFENIRLIHVGSMGVIANLCHNLTFREFNMYLDEHSKGIVTINADSIHCIHCTGKIRVEDCIFENMLDDAINIHGNYTVVHQVTGDKELTVKNVAAGVIKTKLYKAGDQVTVYKGKTQEVVGNYTLSSVSYPNKNETLMTFEETVENVDPGDTVESQRMPEIEIRHCRTGRNRPRGFLISSGSKTIIEECYFNNCSMAIHFTGDTTFWYESGPVNNVTIRNCHFKDCGYSGGDFAIVAKPHFDATETAPYYHRNINITDNTFETFTDGTLYASQCDNIVYKNNTYIQTATYPKRRTTERVILEQCGHREIEDCTNDQVRL